MKENSENQYNNDECFALIIYCQMRQKLIM